MQKPAPIVDSDSSPYWTALKERRLLLKRCRDCGKSHHYPREICPFCHSGQLEWIEAGGEGELYSFTIVHRPAGEAFSQDIPYVVALITLDEGPRMMTRLLNSQGDVRIGQRVRVSFTEGPDGWFLPLFEAIS